jgi:DNA-binding MurR/RpiR family transcriptional regulator
MFSIDEKDVLIAFSFPRYSSRVANAIKFASSKQAKTIAFTDSDISPLAKYADCLLLAQSDMASYMDSLVAPISLINAMIVEITSRREKQIRQRFDKLEDIWQEYAIYEKI